MKKIIILISLFSIGNISNSEEVIVNPTQKIATIPNFKFQSMTSELKTTKIKTEEGIYRIFIIQNAEGVSITAIKIKD